MESPELRAVVDNDVLFKGACYGISEALLFAYVGNRARIGYLAVARFVLVRKISSAALRGSREAAMGRLRQCLERSEELEPTDEEQRRAADLELAAQRAGLRLDTGESQLCAITVGRNIPMLLTGDKRAIAAIEQLLDGQASLHALRGRICCLEQLAMFAVRHSGIAVIRPAICAEPEIDQALTICFGCSSLEACLDNVLRGLNSYISALRAEANRVLSS